MSETPKRKRLTDGEEFRAREVLTAILRDFGIREEPEAASLRSLEEDRLQAREDRKRLAEAFEKMAGFMSEHGMLCWCHDGPCFTRGGQGVLSSECAENNALLTEVGL